jgi:hypothetical protein
MIYEDYFTHNGEKFRTGDKIECYISGLHIKDARLYVVGFNTNSQSCLIYICQNLITGCNMCPNHFGYKYSWSALHTHFELIKLKKVQINYLENIVSLSFPMR